MNNESPIQQVADYLRQHWNLVEANELNYKLEAAEKIRELVNRFIDGEATQEELAKRFHPFSQGGLLNVFVVVRIKHIIQRAPDEFRSALDALWQTEDPDVFWARLEPVLDDKQKRTLGTPGNRAGVPCYFLFAKDPHRFPMYRPEAVKAGFTAVGKPAPSGKTAGDLLRDYFAKVEEIRCELAEAGAPVHDALDVQSGLYQYVAQLGSAKGTESDAAEPGDGSGQQTKLPASPPGAPFNHRTFELLAALQNNPTSSFYKQEYAAFQEHLINPFQQTFRSVIRQLPDAITSVMETEKGLFSRIPKNDYGQGGVWSHYWAALYPKGAKRTSAPQLSMLIESRMLEFGFYIGDYGDSFKERFARNISQDYETLRDLVRESVADLEVVFGRRDVIAIGQDGEVSSQHALTWEDWLKNPAQANYDASIVIPKDELVTLSASELETRMVEAYTRLFPLILIATSDNPAAETQDYLDVLQGEEEDAPLNEPFTLKDVARVTGLAEEVLGDWLTALHRKRQGIFYGPPGTGKTFVAKQLARHLVAGGAGLVGVVQFHPAYSYEDFMQGLRPQLRFDGNLDYRMEPGRFLAFCAEAERRDGPSVLIIDEINRANLSRVFGELMYLLEYREESASLAGGGSFTIPKDVIVIGTMNTADRSIALVDHALRRRFAFFRLQPDYDILLKAHEDSGLHPYMQNLVAVLKRINAAINDPNYEVGITFFLDAQSEHELRSIWRMEIEPYLEEFFVDQSDTLEQFRWEKVTASLRLPS